jgi:hypothetical protein
MAGINRAVNRVRNFSESISNRQVECIFLSHQKKDRDVVEKISKYLIAANIDIYFDENDEDLKFYRQEKNPQGVVNSIKKGINNSSHMLCIVSPNTIMSRWVPWEVGYGFDKTDLAVLTLKGIEENGLPDYLKTTAIVRGTKSLNEYLANITGLSQSLMESKSLIKSYSQSYHPLDNYLDFNL